MRITEFHATNEVASSSGARGRVPSVQLPRMDPNVGRGFGSAFAQLGQTLAQIGREEAELAEKRADAARQTEALTLYTDFARALDQALGDMKLSADPRRGHVTFVQDYDKTARKLFEQTAARASDDVVRGAFMKKAMPFYMERGFEARRYQDKLTVDFHQGGLISYLAEMRRQIGHTEDEETGVVLLNQALAEIDAYAPILGTDVTARMREEFRTTAGNMLARQAMHRDPQSFLPEAAGGADGYKRYADLAKPEYLETLLERAPKLIAHVENRRHTMAERIRQERERVLKEEASAWVNQMEERLLDPQVPAGERPTLHDINLGLAKFHSVLDRSTRDALRKLATDPLVQGGVDAPGAKDEVENAIILRAQEMTPAHIMGRRDLSLATKNALIKELRQRQKLDDISNDHFYRLGEKTIYLQLGGVTPEQAALGFLGLGQFAKPEARANLARALRLFDTRARAVGVRREELPKIADEIVASIQKSTPKEQQQTSTPQAQSPAEPQQQPKSPELPPRQSDEQTPARKGGPGLLNLRRQ